MARCRRPEGSSGPVCLLLLAVLAWASPTQAVERELRFAFHGEPVARRDLASLRAAHPARSVRVFEPYEGREVGFEALPFRQVLDGVYGERWRREEEILFTCRDGYQPTVPVQRLLANEPWLAFDRADEPGFSIFKRESGERKRIELAPFYLVWENLDDEALRRDGDYGWPYQLVAVDLIRPRERFPRMAPPEDAPPPVQRGFRHFRIHCSRCHAMNGEGGTLGADLNRPNPLDYRDRGWLARWIDDPSGIVPSARMPRLNPALPERGRVIEDLLAYLEAMGEAKPGGSDRGG